MLYLSNEYIFVSLVNLSGQSNLTNKRSSYYMQTHYRKKQTKVFNVLLREHQAFIYTFSSDPVYVINVSSHFGFIDHLLSKV